MINLLEDYQGICSSDLCPWNYRGQCGLPAICPGRNKRKLIEKYIAQEQNQIKTTLNALEDNKLTCEGCLYNDMVPAKECLDCFRQKRVDMFLKEG